MKVLKTENEDLLARLESNQVELHMLRKAVESYKLLEEDAHIRCHILDESLKKCQEEFAITKKTLEETIKELRFKLNRLETDFNG